MLVFLPAALILFFIQYGGLLLLVALVLALLWLFVRHKKRVSLQRPLILIALILVSLGLWQFTTTRRVQRIVQQNQDKAQLINFKVYRPNYIPSQQKTRLIYIKTPSEPIDETSGYPFVSMSYSSLVINQFDTTSINASENGNCGPDEPAGPSLSLYLKGLYMNNCDFVTRTDNGFSIYTNSQKDAYYATKDSTRVFIQSSDGIAEVTKIVENLQETNVRTLPFVDNVQYS